MIFNPDKDAQLMVDDWNSKVKAYHLVLREDHLEIDNINILSEHDVEYPDLSGLNLPLHISKYDWLRLTPKLYNNLSTNIIADVPVGVDINEDSKSIQVSAPAISTNITVLPTHMEFDSLCVKIHANFMNGNQRGTLNNLILNGTKYLYLYPAYDCEARALCYDPDPSEWLPVYDKNLTWVIIEWAGRTYTRRVKGVPHIPFSQDGFVGCPAFIPKYKKETR